MSGGRFRYMDSDLKSEIFGYSEKLTNVFEDREISELVFDVLDLIHTFDYYKSGDYDEDDYLEEKAKFKEKWLSDNKSERTKRIIDESVNELKDELYKTFVNSDGEGK